MTPVTFGLNNILLSKIPITCYITTWYKYDLALSCEAYRGHLLIFVDLSKYMNGIPIT